MNWKLNAVNYSGPSASPVAENVCCCHLGPVVALSPASRLGLLYERAHHICALVLRLKIRNSSYLLLMEVQPLSSLFFSHLASSSTETSHSALSVRFRGCCMPAYESATTMIGWRVSRKESAILKQCLRHRNVLLPDIHMSLAQTVQAS